MHTQTGFDLSAFDLPATYPCTSRESELLRQLEEGRLAGRRLQMQNEVALLLAVDDSPEVVMPAILETMCEALGWHWAALWETDAVGQSLAMTSCWHRPSPKYQAFAQLSQQARFAPWECLPGSVWAGGAIWEPHFAARGLFRSEAANKAGLDSAFAFPVSLGSQTLAVVELLSEGVAQPDPDLLNTLKALSYSLSRHLERWRSRNVLAASERRYRLMFEANPMPMLIVDHATGQFLDVNTEALGAYGFSREEFLRMGVERLFAPGAKMPEISLTATKHAPITTRHRRSSGEWMDVEASAYGLPWDGHAAWLLLVKDVTARKRMEQERESMELQLRSAQRLESIGSLAAGIAHEINTPTQYIGDNVRFLGESMTDIIQFVEVYDQLVTAATPVPDLVPAIQRLREKRKQIDWEFLRSELPQAVEQTLAGIDQVARIVKSMKEFSHPGQKDKVLVDLNHAVDNTVTISRNEWKYVADLSTELDPTMPKIPCVGGELNQVLLNLIVNAAHAIADENEKRDRTRGNIVVRTLVFPNSIEIQVQDDGGGIPVEIRERVFDPFFTTKDVGRGTGQGLAIARSVVVDKHGGSLCFETAEGQGTTFYVQLPRNQETLVGDVLHIEPSSASGVAP